MNDPSGFVELDVHPRFDPRTVINTSAAQVVPVRASRTTPLSDPPGSGQGLSRIYRGGGWNSAAAQTRASARDSLGMAYSVLTVVGMRVARNGEP